jgi:hypothetical protein
MLKGVLHALASSESPDTPFPVKKVVAPTHEDDAQREAEMAKLVCSLENKENYTMCSA